MAVSALPEVAWFWKNYRAESELMGPQLAGPTGRGQGVNELCGGLRILRSALAHNQWLGSRQHSVADDMSAVFTRCLSQSDEKVILSVLAL